MLPGAATLLNVLLGTQRPTPGCEPRVKRYAALGHKSEVPYAALRARDAQSVPLMWETGLRVNPAARA